ncbi:MAG: c-type cytochrome [Chitinophagaceae bacterium]
MKKIIVALVITAACACGGGSTENESKPISNSDNSNSQIGGQSATESPAQAAAPAADASAGKGLIEGSDCRTCHKDNEKLIGPAYADVAKKYENNAANVTMLAKKVIEGGKGNWGEIPMTAHPQLSQSDAESMVSYILSMKK